MSAQNNWMTLAECVEFFSGRQQKLADTPRTRAFEDLLRKQCIRPFAYLYWYVMSTGSVASLVRVNHWLHDKKYYEFIEVLLLEPITAKVTFQLEESEVRSKLNLGWNIRDLLANRRLMISPLVRCEFILSELPESHHGSVLTNVMVRNAQMQLLGIQSFRDHVPYFNKKHYKERLCPT